MDSMTFTISHDPESSPEEPFLLVDENDGSISWWPTLAEALNALRGEATTAFATEITVTKAQMVLALEEAYRAGEKAAVDYLVLIAQK